MEKDLPPTLAMSAMIRRVPEKALAYLVYGMEEIDAEAARTLGLVSAVFPGEHLEKASARLTRAMRQRSRPALVAVKDYLRVAPGLTQRAARDFAGNLLATLLSSVSRG